MDYILPNITINDLRQSNRVLEEMERSRLKSLIKVTKQKKNEIKKDFYFTIAKIFLIKLSLFVAIFILSLPFAYIFLQTIGKESILTIVLSYLVFFLLLWIFSRLDIFSDLFQSYSAKIKALRYEANEYCMFLNQAKEVYKNKS